MTHLYLNRFAQSDSGTFGVITLDNKPIAVTCEDPWKDNKTGESCIPEGTYKCVPHSGEKYKNVWRLENVPNRTAILIHNGNTIKDTQGCILVGEKLGYVVGRPAILNSKRKLTELQATLPKEFMITINSLKG